MKRTQFHGLKQSLKHIIRQHFNVNNGKYIAFFVVAIFGVGLGMFSAFSTLEIFSLPFHQSNFFLFSINRLSLGSYFLAKLLNVCVIVFVIFLLGFTLYTVPLLFLIVGYRGFALSYDIVLLVTNTNITGIIHAVVIVIPVNIVILLLIVASSVTAFNRCQLLKHNYNTCYTDERIFHFVKRLGILLLLCAAVHLIEVLFISVLFFSVGTVL